MPNPIHAFRPLLLLAGLATAGAAAGQASAQTALDRVDPARIESQVPQVRKQPSDVTVKAAAPAATAAAPAEAPITVGAITVTGLKVLHPADFADIFETYVGRTLSPGALAGLADAIAARARARGYVFATASIAPQRLEAGLLRVSVDEGAIDEVRLAGYENRAVKAALAPLVGAGPIVLAEIQRRLLIAGDVDGLWLRRTRFLREGSRNVLLVDVGRDRVSGVVGLDNSGSRPVGPLQADLTVKIAQLLADDDLVTVSAVLTPTEPSELAYGRIRYSKRVSAAGTEINASYSYASTHPGAYLEPYDIAGRSWTATVGVLQPLSRGRTESLWAQGSFEVRTVRQDSDGDPLRRDRLAVFRLGVYGFTEVLGGRLRGSATLSQGTDLFGATKQGDPLASRHDADATFTTATLSGTWTGPLFARVSAQVTAASQLSSQPLLVSEEVGLGGGSFLRAYDYSERSGDQGAMGSGELRYVPVDRLGPLSKPQLYTYLDGGRVTNLAGGFGTGTLFSAGAGLRSTIAKSFWADAEVAFPLSGDRYDSGNADPVFNFRMTKSF